VDVHHHFVPPGYEAALKANGIRPVRWTLQASLEEMNKSGIATAILCLPPPSITFGDLPFGRKLSRESNEAAARIVGEHPGRFGSFAAIPYADIEGSLAEIRHALDTLRADGIALMTSYGGKYLGDPAFWPILEELNRRKAVVYTHPTSPACCTRTLPLTSINTIEGPVDTTRTMASLMFAGGAARFPDIRWIFSHSGGVTPFLLSRFERHGAEARDSKEKMPDGPMHELRKFYYDTAQGNHPGALFALMQMVPVSQVLYGTDYPFIDGATVTAGLARHGFSAADLRAINRENALRLLPHLKA
jgi:predicted TIM-barrel fold metal-dependent hydrolase